MARSSHQGELALDAAGIADIASDAGDEAIMLVSGAEAAMLASGADAGAVVDMGVAGATVAVDAASSGFLLQAPRVMSGIAKLNAQISGIRLDRFVGSRSAVWRIRGSC